MLSELIVVIIYHTYTHQIITLCILHLYIICQLYLNKTGGNFYKLQKKKIPFMSSSLNSQNNPSNISVRSCHFCAQNFLWTPIFLRAKAYRPHVPGYHIPPLSLLPTSLQPRPLFVKHKKYNAASGSLHLLNPLSGMLCL